MADDKKEYRFKTGPVIVSRAYLEPPKEPNTYGRWVNTAEVYADEGNDLKEMRSVILECAKDNGVATQVGLKQQFENIFKRLESTNKDAEKNEHLVGKIFFALQRSRKPGDRNLADPAERKEWLTYLVNERPKAYFINKERKRELISIDKLREMIYPGCCVNIVGEAYWANAPYNRVCIDLQAVVLLEQRERVGPAGGRRSDDDDELLNSIAEPSKNQGDDLDALFGDKPTSNKPSDAGLSVDDIPF